MTAQVPVLAVPGARRSPRAAPSEVARSGFDVEKFAENFEVLAEATGGVDHLRDLVIGLALRGSLVPQHPKDAPANDLLERAKRALGDRRESRVVDGLEPAPYALPSGWVWCQPQDIGVVSPRNEARDDAEVGFVPMNIVPIDYRGALMPERRRWGDIKKGYTHVADGDLAVAKITPCFQNRKSCVMRDLPGGLGAGTTELLVLRPVPGIVVAEYLLLYFKSPHFVLGGIPRMTGTAGQKRVPGDYFAAAPFPLPPLAEQKRIVAKVDELMRLLDDLEAKQTKKREVQTRLRTAALDALTSAEGPEAFETAWKRVAGNFGVLLDRSGSVYDLRQALLGLAYSGALVGQRNQWPSAAIEDVSVKIVDCPHTTPKWTERGIICLRTTNFKAGGLDLSEVRYVSRETYEERVARLKPEPGDIVYSREGGILGIACVIPPQSHVCLGQRMMMMRLDLSKCVPDFVALMLNAPQTTVLVEKLTGGTASPHLNVGDVRKFTVPVPSLATQRGLLRKVEHLMKLCDDLEAKLHRAETTAAKLVEAVVSEMVGA